MSKRRAVRRNKSDGGDSAAPSSESASQGPIKLKSALTLGAPVQEVLLVIGPALLLFLLGLDHLWVTEDAFITMRSVENVWAGYGPVFNRGIRVESFSHPLWFIMLCALRVFGQEMLPMAAALLGLVLSCAGLALATMAARERCSTVGTLLPYGALVVGVLPPFWHFASSGLETGLTFFWIGLSSWCLGRVADDPKRWGWLSCLVIGIAPLIRPDLVILGAPLLIAAMMLGQAAMPGVLGKVIALCWFVVPGALWQVFRMGYYGALLPNTYLAKEGLNSRWDQGFAYLFDLLGTYWLLPVLAIGALLKLRSFTLSSDDDSSSNPSGPHCYIPFYGLCIAGLLHAAVVCRTGGDFMHARLLLPALFSLASAFAVVPLQLGRRSHTSIRVAFTLWAGLIMLCVRPSQGSGISKSGIADERQWYMAHSSSARPVFLKDYEFNYLFRVAEQIVDRVHKERLKAIYWGNIGITVARLPDEIIVIDPLALNDHIGARTRIMRRGRPGHEKLVSPAWFLARYPAGQGIVVADRPDGAFLKEEPEEKVEAARRVLATPALRELEEAVTAPLTVDTFLKNIGRAWRLTVLRFPADPVEALAAFGVSNK